MKDPFEQYEDYNDEVVYDKFGNPTDSTYSYDGRIEKKKEKAKRYLEGLANRNISESKIDSFVLEQYGGLMTSMKNRIKSEETKWYARDPREGKLMRQLPVDFLYWVINNYESEKLLEMAMKELASRILSRIEHLERSEITEWKKL
jgi:hypothetical protein